MGLQGRQPGSAFTVARSAVDAVVVRWSLYQGTEFVWMACALVFLGSFGLGCTLQKALARVRKNDRREQ
jgi:hypothetical protein